MRLIFTTLFVATSFVGVSQKLDSLEIVSNLTGEWIFDYYINIEPSGEIDTFYVKRDTLPVIFGLKITNDFVDEFLGGREDSKDTIVFMGYGPWEISQRKNSFWVNFRCDGIILCGLYEIISIEPGEIILKVCSKYEQDGCELIHLTRIIRE